MAELEGKIALITGSSRGIGAAIAKDLAANGASVVINYHSNEEAANAVVAEITAAGGQAIAMQADVSDFDQASALIKDIKKTLGRLDILVNNAGTTRDNVIMLMKEADWDKVIEILCNEQVRKRMVQAHGSVKLWSFPEEYAKKISSFF
jgi:NAD(P)-dependent dehydrogenase (short-subunit alcohol dehydrogenase family)